MLTANEISRKFCPGQSEFQNYGPQPKNHHLSSINAAPVLLILGSTTPSYLEVPTFGFLFDSPSLTLKSRSCSDLCFHCLFSPCAFLLPNCNLPLSLCQNLHAAVHLLSVLLYDHLLGPFLVGWYRDWNLHLVVATLSTL